jgi:hypothetical protein
MGLVSLIVMEPGSAWPGYVGDSENVVAIVDRQEGLLQRVQERIATLRRGGEQVRIAILACNESIDGPSALRRTELARELHTAVASVRFGRLVLSAAERASAPVRRELFLLASRLSQAGGGPAPIVSVKFKHDPGGKADMP